MTPHHYLSVRTCDYYINSHLHNIHCTSEWIHFPLLKQWNGPMNASHLHTAGKFGLFIIIFVFVWVFSLLYLYFFCLQIGHYVSYNVYLFYLKDFTKCKLSCPTGLAVNALTTAAQANLWRCHVISGLWSPGPAGGYFGCSSETQGIEIVDLC